jgi:hypothetical protein
MKKEKFTPGPWMLGSVREINNNEMGGVLEIMPEYEPDGWHTPVCWINGNGKMETGANARLISQAPAMYKLLESAVSLWGFMANDFSLSVTERMAAKNKHAEAKAVLMAIDGE